MSYCQIVGFRWKMGGVVSSGRMSTLIQVLKQDNCPSTHQVWQGISVDDMSDLYLSDDDINDLIFIQNLRQDNFSELVRVTVDVFSKASKLSEQENSQNPNYVSLCNFVCVLLSISNDAEHYQCWFKPPTLYLTSITPLRSLTETLQRLLRFNDPMNTFLQSSILDLRISYIKTLLFIVHAQSFGDHPRGPGLSQFLLNFDFFQWLKFLLSLFESIPFVILNPKSSQKALLFIRSMITFAVPCLYSCPSWKISQVDVHLINSALSVITHINSEKVLQISEQLISLMYIIVMQNPNFLEYIVKKKYSNSYIVPLLYMYQYRLENQKVSFFHTVILLILNIFTANYSVVLSLNEPFASTFNAKMRPHRGTHADLMIEILTNPQMQNFSAYAPLTSLVAGIIANISSTTVRLSWFSSNRILIYLKKFFVTKFSEKSEYVRPIENLLLSIYQILRFQANGNISMFMFALENQKLLEFALQKEEWRKHAERILRVIKAAEKSLIITNEQKRNTEFQNSISKVLVDFSDLPEKSIEFAMTKEIESIWFDWFRVLFWTTFPEDANRAKLKFNSFEIPKDKDDVQSISLYDNKEEQKTQLTKNDDKSEEEITKELSKPKTSTNEDKIANSDYVEIQKIDKVGKSGGNNEYTIIKDENKDKDEEDEEEFREEKEEKVELSFQTPIQDPNEIEDLFGGDEELMKFLDGE